VTKVRIIGDVHGFYDAYIPIAEEADYSIQIGDMGFNYSPLNTLDSKKHKFFGGNHDNYDIYFKSPHVLWGLTKTNNYGPSDHGGLKFFFVRGAFSIDWKHRQKTYLMGGGKSYWEGEELYLEDMRGCLREYKKYKPEIVITHECPRSISSKVGNNSLLSNLGYDPKTFSTRTSELLQTMLDAHKPKLWIFGHYHVAFDENINGTNFVCLPELGYTDIYVEE
jgi:predicted phosphodiesterase